MFSLRFKVFAYLYLSRKWRKLCQPHPILSCVLWIIIFLLTDWAEGKIRVVAHATISLFCHLFLVSQITAFFLKLILKQTNRLVLLTSVFPDNWNNILDRYLIIPPHHSFENYEICYWFEIEWLQDWNCGTNKASMVFKEMLLHLRTCSLWNHSINK